MNAAKDKQGAPPVVISSPPERDLERKLKLRPDDADAKADVGSDESMMLPIRHQQRTQGGMTSRRRRPAFQRNHRESNGSVTKMHRRCK